MKKYTAWFSIGASVVIEVEAETKELAEEAAWEQVQIPLLCCHCSKELDTGDIIDLVEIEES